MKARDAARLSTVYKTGISSNQPQQIIFYLAQNVNSVKVEKTWCVLTQNVELYLKTSDKSLKAFRHCNGMISIYKHHVDSWIRAGAEKWGEVSG